MAINLIGSDLPARAYFSESKVGKTGLTVTVDVYAPDGSALVTGGAVTEIGGGFYGYTLAGASVTLAGVYLYLFKTATTSVDAQHVPAAQTAGQAWVERILGTIAAGTHAPQSGDAYARLGVAGVGLTNLGDARLANLDAAISSRSSAAALATMQGDVTAIGLLVTAIDDLTKAAGAGDLAAIKLAAERLSSARADLLDDLISMVEDVSGNRFNAKALEQAPAGGGGGGLDAAGVRAAVGLAEANLDDQLAVITAQVLLITPDASITILNPVSDDGDVIVEAGADYAAPGITFTSAGWPDLTGATVVAYVRGQTLPMGVVSSGGATQQVGLPLASAATLAMPGGTYPWRVDATIAGVVTPLLRGDWIHRPRP